MNEHPLNDAVENQQVNQHQQELQHLITVSTGFIDAYIIDCYAKEPMLLPQNIVLSAQDTATDISSMEWHDVKLPVYHINDSKKLQGVALIIEGDDISQRFALMCDEMPQSIRLRISELTDDAKERQDPSIFQYVKMDEKLFQIPNLDYIQKSLVG